MALYRVIIPFSEGAAAQVRYATVEVEADSETTARRVALSEFEEMSVLSTSDEPASIVQEDIRVERASVTRRSAFDIAVTNVTAQIATARLVGSLNSHNFHKLQETLDHLKHRGVARLVLDLSGLTYVNSTGLSLFVAASDLFDLRLAAVPVKIAHILKMIGLDQMLPTFAAVGEAAKAPPGRQPGKGA